jgi:hypothetical protein
MHVHGRSAAGQRRDEKDGHLQKNIIKSLGREVRLMARPD